MSLKMFLVFLHELLFMLLANEYISRDPHYSQKMFIQ